MLTCIILIPAASANHLNMLCLNFLFHSGNTMASAIVFHPTLCWMEYYRTGHCIARMKKKIQAQHIQMICRCCRYKYNAGQHLQNTILIFEQLHFHVVKEMSENRIFSSCIQVCLWYRRNDRSLNLQGCYLMVQHKAPIGQHHLDKNIYNRSLFRRLYLFLC